MGELIYATGCAALGWCDRHPRLTLALLLALALFALSFDDPADYRLGW